MALLSGFLLITRRCTVMFNIPVCVHQHNTCMVSFHSMFIYSTELTHTSSERKRPEGRRQTPDISRVKVKVYIYW